ncbi:radical SAM protein [Aquabacterium sp. J223]|uniref:radical SAM protein n=1 Tax=Aquabacterium sp. J223 TaxID=2898431 RepID=UPI0021ADEAD5|nr:radical SAM protein [Aquabacterium sp. J223]UUX95068.1 radical SAM protein [Aquabacterium sp. J223]
MSAASPRRPPLPAFAQVEPIGRCNLACRMCTVNERGDAVAELGLDRFDALLDQLPGLQELHLQGLGEPMLHPGFFDMVRRAVARGIRVSANSNLTLLTERRARACVTSGLHTLSVSLDGATAATYEAVRRKASFAKVLRNLDRLVAERDAAGSALEVRGVMVLMRGNLHELPALVRLLHDHGVHALLVQRLSSDLDQPDLPARYIPIRRYVDEAELHDADRPRMAEVFDAARALAHRLSFNLHLPKLPAAGAAPPADAAGGPGRCTWPSDQLYLTAAGELLPCCMVATADRASFGNVFDEGEDLASRWNGAAAQSFRAALDSDQPPAVCRSCALYRGVF